MRDIVDVIEHDIVNLIDNTVKVTEVISSDPDYVYLKSCDYKWLKPGGYLLSSNNVKYICISIDEDGVIQLKNAGQSIVKRQILTLKAPVFVHGTYRVANQEWLQGVGFDLRDGVPLIWLVETIQGQRYQKDHAQDFDAMPRLFFLDETNPEGSLNTEQREQGVKPMLALVTEFYKVIDDSFNFARDTGSFERTISRFGTEDKEGMIKNILEAYLGGVEIRPTITISKDVGCNC